MNAVAYIVAGFALVVIVFGGSQLMGPYFGKYAITNDSIEFVMFGKFHVWSATFEDITEIQPISFAQSMFVPALHLMNRPFAQYVLIRRRSGLFKKVLITPDEPEEFVRAVHQRIGARTNPR
jgi:hypothetical protein